MYKHRHCSTSLFIYIDLQCNGPTDASYDSITKSYFTKGNCQFYQQKVPKSISVEITKQKSKVYKKHQIWYRSPKYKVCSLFRIMSFLASYNFYVQNTHAIIRVINISLIAYVQNRHPIILFIILFTVSNVHLVFESIFMYFLRFAILLLF